MSYDTTACVLTAIVVYVLSCLSLALRIYVRFFLLRNVAIDDYFAAIAAVTNSALSISYILGILRYGLGSDIPREDSQHGLKVILFGELFYFLTTYLAKLSFIFTLFRIVISKVHSYTLYLLAITGAVISIFAWFWVLFFCKPVQYFGSKVLVADISLGLALPVLLLWNSKMHRKMRASVYVLLGVGSVASIATIVRLIYLPRKPASKPLMANHPIIFWSVIEAAISIICTGGVTLKPLVVRLGVFGHSRSHTNPENSSTAARLWGPGPGLSPSDWTQGGGIWSGHSIKWYGKPLELETQSMPSSPPDEMGTIVVRMEIHLHRDHY